MALQALDLVEWELVLGKMLRYHFNIGEEIKELIKQIRKEMKEELVPIAEDRANYGKVVKQAIRSMWGLEYEILDIQSEFAKSIGSVDIQNLTDDFVEEVMLQSKPLQGILLAIRKRQKAKMEEIKKEYGEKYKELEPMKIPRPPKPEPKPEKEPEPAAKEGEKPAESAPDAAPAAGDEAPPAAEAAPEAEAPVPEPAPAVVEQPIAVEASA